jgi:hypothetical protein
MLRYLSRFALQIPVLLLRLEAGSRSSGTPICYLGDEWFCPEGSATIAIPFDWILQLCVLTPRFACARL